MRTLKLLVAAVMAMVVMGVTGVGLEQANAQSISSFRRNLSRSTGIAADASNTTFTTTIMGMKMKVVTDNTTTTARTITAAESGTIFVMASTSDDPGTRTLPAAAAGLVYGFVDLDATAAADLCVDVQTGDAIGGGTAGVSYNSTGDAVGNTLLLLSVDGTNWVILSSNGTWGAGT